MNRFISCIAAISAILILASCTGKVADVEVGPYTVSVIQKNVYHIQDYNASNPAGETFDAEGNVISFNNCSDIYLIVGKKEALLIDLSNKIRWADNAEESLRKLVTERIEGKPLTITFTHNHGDHVGMMGAYVTDATVRFALPETDFARLIDRFPATQCEFINEGHVFDLGGYQVSTIAVPGHTDGSLVFCLDGHDILFTGDAIGSGHGVWIFNAEAYMKYIEGVTNLVSWIENPKNKVDLEKLCIYGGHYWQRDWLPELGDNELGISYIRDMQELLKEMKEGTAASEPSGLGRPNLDTYFRHGSAIITWNAEQAQQYAAEN